MLVLCNYYINWHLENANQPLVSSLVMFLLIFNMKICCVFFCVQYNYELNIFWFEAFEDVTFGFWTL